MKEALSKRLVQVTIAVALLLIAGISILRGVQESSNARHATRHAAVIDYTLPRE